MQGKRNNRVWIVKFRTKIGRWQKEKHCLENAALAAADWYSGQGYKTRVYYDERLY